VVSLTEHVDPAIELIEHGFRDFPGGPAALAYLRSHAYFNQLPPADACLGSLLDYELDPESSRPVGGSGKSLAAIVGPHNEVAEPLRRAVATTITASYLAMLSTEDPPGSDWVPGRDAESLWRFWVDHLGPAATLVFGIPDRFGTSVTRDGSGYLEAEVKRLGLGPGFLQRKTLSQRCAELSRFGLVLRAGQTTACSDAEFGRALTV